DRAGDGSRSVTRRKVARLSAAVGDLADDLGERALLGPHDHDPHAARRERQRDSASCAVDTARNQRDLAREALHGARLVVFSPMDATLARAIDARAARVKKDRV